MNTWEPFNATNGEGSHLFRGNDSSRFGKARLAKRLHKVADRRGTFTIDASPIYFQSETSIRLPLSSQRYTHITRGLSIRRV